MTWQVLKFYRHIRTGKRVCYVQHSHTRQLRKWDRYTEYDLRHCPTYEHNPKFLEFGVTQSNLKAPRSAQIGDLVWCGSGLDFGECVADLGDDMEVALHTGPHQVLEKNLLKVVHHQIEGMREKDTEGVLRTQHNHRLTTMETYRYAVRLQVNRALSWLHEELDSTRSISQDLIMELHTRMFGELVTWGGQFRDCAIEVGRNNWPTPPHEQVPALMRDFCTHRIPDIVRSIRHAHDARRGMCQGAAMFYFELCDIHPFVDGNGRVSRALIQYLSAHALQENAYLFQWNQVGQLGNKTDRAFEVARESNTMEGRPQLNALAMLLDRCIVT